MSMPGIAAVGLAIACIYSGPANAAPRSAPMTVTSSGSATSNIGGRPANLDPRIAWLEDLRMPQSGGPEPLVKTAEFPLPGIGGVQSLAAFGDSLGFVIRHRGRPPTLFMMGARGDIRWSRSLPDGVVWGLAADASVLYCIPVAISERARTPPEVIGLDYVGAIVKLLAWPLNRAGGRLGEVVLRSGVIAGDYPNGSRVFVRVDPSSTADPESVMTMEDVAIGGDFSADDVRRARREGYALLGARTEDERLNSEHNKKLNVKRRKRTAKIRGRRLQIGALPMFDPSQDPQMGDWWKTATNPGYVLSVERDGSVWARFVIHNPHRLPQDQMEDLGLQKTKNSSAGQMMGVGGLALYAPDGQLRGYYILGEDDTDGYPVDGAIYITCKGSLVRLEPMKAR